MKAPTRQSGMTLLVAMIMLALITLLVINTVNLGGGSVQTVSNMQFRNQAAMAAEEALQTAISSKRFFETPSAVFTEDCDGSYNAKCIDLNGDGQKDITVTLTPSPTCVQAKTLNNNELLIVSDEDAQDCFTAMPQEYLGIIPAPVNDSLCARSVWEIRAQASDAVTNASATATQGVYVIVPKDKVDTACPL